MTYFKEVEPEGQVAILAQNGVFKQAPLYTRAGYLFAKTAGGFVRLAANGSTSHPSIRIDALIYDGALCQDALGRLCEPSAKGARSLERSSEQLLLGVKE